MNERDQALKVGDRRFEIVDAYGRKRPDSPPQFWSEHWDEKVGDNLLGRRSLEEQLSVVKANIAKLVPQLTKQIRVRNRGIFSTSDGLSRLLNRV